MNDTIVDLFASLYYGASFFAFVIVLVKLIEYICKLKPGVREYKRRSTDWKS